MGKAVYLVAYRLSQLNHRKQRRGPSLLSIQGVNKGKPPKRIYSFSMPMGFRLWRAKAPFRFTAIEAIRIEPMLKICRPLPAAFSFLKYPRPRQRKPSPSNIQSANAKTCAPEERRNALPAGLHWTETRRAGGLQALAPGEFLKVPCRYFPRARKPCC